MAREIRIRINLDNCQACRRCLAVSICKTHAIMQIDPGEPPYVEVERCHDCGSCLEACPLGAIESTGAMKRASKPYPVFAGSS